MVFVREHRVIDIEHLRIRFVLDLARIYSKASVTIESDLAGNDLAVQMRA